MGQILCRSQDGGVEKRGAGDRTSLDRTARHLIDETQILIDETKIQIAALAMEQNKSSADAANAISGQTILPLFTINETDGELLEELFDELR